jgi:hypothetical protein
LASRWTDAAWLQSYLDSDESDLVAATVRECQSQVRKAGPTAVMRLEGIVMLYVLARRAGLAALSEGLDPTPDAEPKARPADGDDVGKAQERLRKAIKEFDDALGVTQDTTPTGLADLLKPLLKDAEGIVEAAVASGNGHQHPEDR